MANEMTPLYEKALAKHINRVYKGRSTDDKLEARVQSFKEGWVACGKVQLEELQKQFQVSLRKIK